MNIEKLIRPNILHLEPYHSARERIQKGILLDANENPYSAEWSGVLLNRYPDPYQRKLRRALAEYVGVGVENVAAGTGSDEVLDWIFKVFCQPRQDQVAIVEPTYGMYRVTAQIFGVAVFECLLDTDFSFQADPFLRTVPSQVKVVFLCSPNNPTGNVLDRSQILKLCREGGRIVVVDEAYVEFSSVPSLVSEINHCPNLIVLRTLSKAFARAALRLGYAVASEKIVSYFLKVKAPYNVNSVTLAKGVQVLSRAALETGHVQAILRERDRVAGCLNDIPGVEKVFPSQANFLLFRCDRASEICEELLERRIVVRDRSSMPLIGGCIRVTIGKPEENDLFINELQTILQKVIR